MEANWLLITFVLFVVLGMLALGVLLFTRKLMTAAFLLFAVLLVVGAVYVFTGAEFLAVAQLIVYVGGILVLIIFGVMLTQRDQHAEPQTGFVNVLPAVLITFSVVGGLGYLVQRFTANPPPWLSPTTAASTLTNPEQIGMLTLTQYLLPFEAMSVLLLVALIGAIYLARTRTGDMKTHESP